MNELQKLLAALKAIRTEWEGKVMPEDVQKDFSEKMDQAKALKAQAEEMKALDELVAFDEEGTGRKTTPVGATETVPATTKSKEPVFRELGEQLMAVKMKEDADIKSINMLAEVEARAKAQGLNEAVDSEGGSLIQPNFSKEIYDTSFAGGELLKRIDLNPVDGPIMEIPAVDEQSRKDGYRSGGIRSYWRVEAGLMAKSNPTFRNISLKLKNLYVLGYATDEMLHDVSFLGSWMMKKFSEEVTFNTEDKIYEGLGGGFPLGMTKAPCVVSVAKETSQTAVTVVAENLAKMRARMPIPSRKTAIWVYNQDVESQLLTLEFNDYPVMLPAGGWSGKPFNTIWGAPAIPIEYAETLGTVGDIAYIDPNEYIGINQTPKAAQSMHVRFLYGEQAFRLTYRFDGQPKWASSLTPFKGTNKLSPFITLATRA